MGGSWERAEISAFLKTRRKAFLSLHDRRKAFLSFHSRRKAILYLHSWLGDVQVCRTQLVQAIQRKVSAVTHSGGRSPQPRICILSTRSIPLLHSSSISLLHRKLCESSASATKSSLIRSSGTSVRGL